jgi:hypothetical protein
VFHRLPYTSKASDSHNSQCFTYIVRDELIPNGSEKLTNLLQLAKKVTNLFQMGVSNLFRLTQKVSFDELIPIGADELIPIRVDEPIPLDVSVLFSRPKIS